MRHAYVLLLALLAFAGAALMTGTESAGRLLLQAGAPSLALPLLKDKSWMGLALYRSERYAEAAEAFRQAGTAAGYNRGTALAQARDFEISVQSLEAVLARDPGDADAKANYDLILSFIDGATEDGSGPNPLGKQLGEHVKTNNGTDTMTMEEAFEKVRERSKQITRPADKQNEITANSQWLATLRDEPGHFLKLRIAAEYARRKESGEAPPPGGDPW